MCMHAKFCGHSCPSASFLQTVFGSRAGKLQSAHISAHSITDIELLGDFSTIMGTIIKYAYFIVSCTGWEVVLKVDEEFQHAFLSDFMAGALWHCHWPNRPGMADSTVVDRPDKFYQIDQELIKGMAGSDRGQTAIPWLNKPMADPASLVPSG